MKPTFFAKAALISVSLAVTASICFAAEKTLNITIPKQLDSNKVFMLIGQQSEKCLSLKNNKMRDGKSELSFSIQADTQSVKFYIFYPGYKIITTELKAEDISSEKPLSPKFEKLPTVPVTIKLTKSDGSAISNQQVYIRQPRAETEYFQLISYKFQPADAAPVASGVTDENGFLTVDLPQLLDDSFFNQPGIWGKYYEVGMDLGWDCGGYRLDPGSFRAQKSYPEPVLIKHRER